jgi:hypothetical protein
MPSRYRVLQYFPDLVTGECINIAVIAYDDTAAFARTLQDWSRVQAFGGGSTEILQTVAQGLRQWTPEQARGYRMNEMSCLQLTEPRASITTAEELIDRIADRMLVEPHHEKAPAE